MPEVTEFVDNTHKMHYLTNDELHSSVNELKMGLN